MNRDRALVLALTFITSRFALELSTSLLGVYNSVIDALFEVWCWNCSGNERCFHFLQAFFSNILYSFIFLVSSVKYLVSDVTIIQVVCNMIIEVLLGLSNANTLLWTMLSLCHFRSFDYCCYILSPLLPNLYKDMLLKVTHVYRSFMVTTGFGGLLLIIAILVFIFLVYFSYLISVVIIRLYKIFIAPLLKVLGRMVDIRRRFVLRARGM